MIVLLRYKFSEVMYSIVNLRHGIYIRKELERAELSILTPYATNFTENRKNAEVHKNESLSFNMYFEKSVTASTS